MAENVLSTKAGEKTVLCIGAHPDDCEMSCSGTAALWAESANKVIFLSVTDGRSGHHLTPGDTIAERRRVEAQRAAAMIGAESRVLEFHDGFLEPTVENRLEIIRNIRELMPDIVITNRPNDYHPDHRYTAQLVQDSAYMLMVPHVLPELEPLTYNPIILYWADTFTYPRAFRPDIAVVTDSVLATKLEMLGCHESQVYEWLPFIERYSPDVPDSAEDRKKWLESYYLDRTKSKVADLCRDKLVERYGSEAAGAVRHAEAFELCEYGTMPDKKGLLELFSGHLIDE